MLIERHDLATLKLADVAAELGLTTNAVYGFTAMLINLLRDEAPTHVAAAFDVSRQTFRSDAYVDYKANRSKSPDEFRGQVDLVKEVLDALNIVHIELDGYEADDVIATLARQASAAHWETLICTGDRDSLQLVDAATTVLYPRKGVSDLMRFTPESVEEKYGVPPFRYPELAALVGETSDNLPGIPGVGPKTAAKWLQEYGSLDQLMARAGEIKGVAGQNLRDTLAWLPTGRQLVTIKTDCDGLPALGPEGFRRLADDGRRFYADPFLFEQGGETFLATPDRQHASVVILAPVNRQPEVLEGGIERGQMPIAFSVGEDTIAVEYQRTTHR